MKANKQQTAVEWLIDKLSSQPIDDINDEYWHGIISKAKQMEKEQLISFGYSQIQYVDAEIGDLIYKKVPEEIYTETYGRP